MDAERNIGETGGREAGKREAGEGERGEAGKCEAGRCETGAILLHACCGPCTLEPSRLLREQGFSPTVYYANPNIEPQDEYALRLQTLRNWAETAELPVIEAPYDNVSWRAEVAERSWDERAQRCRACYRIRFEATARYAAEHAFPAIGTTLSVSPYQHTGVIREELERAAQLFGLQARFEDYRPNYDEATRRSRALGMYRQNYCGCALSRAEAQRERDERKAARAAQREAREREYAAEREAAEKSRAAAKAAKQEYEKERARRKQVLRALRQQREDAGAEDSG